MHSKCQKFLEKADDYWNGGETMTVCGEMGCRECFSGSGVALEGKSGVLVAEGDCIQIVNGVEEFVLYGKGSGDG
ncbi:hypothetical protein BWQ96_08443 [Gracilariopsis chorda]|uniref:Uncharacterized protein n=1 Tax=Gracilariopsis chorda TaxID=448386 RepID=A0A2V3IIA6_9FLOR|nr:hypothetical protein BWQ96_08443 [Gracilariopsis chorda]|eukprot:PXF41824.1 hypothetical protein BWQ96_08443 [Gracilariopsis chorda]